MTVGELIARLEACDPEARVLVLSQPSWPFECALAGVAVREDFEDADDAERRPTDVCLLEGTQLRYGNKTAWDAGR